METPVERSASIETSESDFSPLFDTRADMAKAYHRYDVTQPRKRYESMQVLLLDAALIKLKDVDQVVMQLGGLRMTRPCSPLFGRATWPPFQVKDPC